MLRYWLSLFLVAASAAGQVGSDRVKSIAAEVANVARLTAESQPPISNPFAKTVDSSAFAGFAAAALMDGQIRRSGVDAQFYQSLMDAIEVSVGKQVGSTGDTKGTTSLAMKGTVPEILGLAVEHGAITREVSGNIVTFRATPAGIIKALEGQDFANILKVKVDSSGNLVKGSCDWCDRFSGSFSFDVSRGSTPGTLTANKQQIAAWSARVELVNHRNPRLRMYFQQFQNLAQGKGFHYIQIHDDLSKALISLDAYKAWNAALVNGVLEQVDSELAAKRINLDDAEKKFVDLITPALSSLSNEAQIADAVQVPLRKYAQQVTDLIKDRAAIYDLANRGLLVTADWTVTRDPSVPDLSMLTSVVETSAGPKGKHDLTVNIAAAFYNSAPSAPARRFHDFRTNLQYDIPLGTFRSYGPFVFSLAGRYEYIPKDVVASNTNLTSGTGGAISGMAGPAAMAPQGNLVVGQAKLTIPVKGSGVKIPLSVTVANRTELIKEKDVRANIGITFDLDTIFARTAAK